MSDAILSSVPPTGCRVFITGGAQGIGRAMADAFAARGARIAILDAAPMPNAPASWIIRQGSVADPVAVEGVVAEMEQKWGGIDVAIANAGLSANRPTLGITLDAWRQVLDVNLTGVFLTAQAAARRMVPAKSGVILATTSIYAERGGAERAAYAATKGGVANLVRALASEWGASNVRVNGISPGYADTALTRELIANGRIDPVAIIGRTPMRRLGRTQEAAAVACFLASPAAAFINGAILPVDGGWSANTGP